MGAPQLYFARMADIREHIDQLADLMGEFDLQSARLSGEGWVVEFARQAEPTAPAGLATPATALPRSGPASPGGTPITSPMPGIFYLAPSPGAAPFVSVGEPVVAGQVVGLIEAMKVFSEIQATISGTVTHIAAESGMLVEPGDPLLYIS